VVTNQCGRWLASPGQSGGLGQRRGMSGQAGDLARGGADGEAAGDGSQSPVEVPAGIRVGRVQHPRFVLAPAVFLVFL
jgi:hypothetical protein